MKEFISKLLGYLVNKFETPIAVMGSCCFPYEFDVEGQIDNYGYLITCRSRYKPNFAKFDNEK